MFGGLTKTSSRIAIVAALGLTLGGIAFKATPVKAADLGGDCCADLEERVAELEATTVRKGNKKVSVTLSGWVIKSMNFWDDGKISGFAVGDKDADLVSRFSITGSATIAPGWSAGYNLTVGAPGNVFGIASNQFNENNFLIGDIYTLYSYIYIKSDAWGTLNWGRLSPASDNPAVLADVSGTVIESNAVFFEGGGFQLRPKGKGGKYSGLGTFTWDDFLTCYTGGGIGADCFGAPRPAVRYDSPTWGGFRFETSYGTVDNSYSAVALPTPEDNFWDFAAFYTADWNSIKLSAAYAFTWTEGNIGGERLNCTYDTAGNCVSRGEAKLNQIGASILHKPSGLGIYGLYQNEQVEGGYGLVGTFAPTSSGTVRRKLPDTDVWYLKPFWRHTLTPLGATVLYGEYGQYNDQFGGIFNGTAGVSVSGFLVDPANCPTGLCYVTGSEVQRWGLGVVQEIDSAAMHVWARWQHQELDLNITQYTAGGTNLGGVKSNFDSWDLFQVGGIIFF